MAATGIHHHKKMSRCIIALIVFYVIVQIVLCDGNNLTQVTAANNNRTDADSTTTMPAITNSIAEDDNRSFDETSETLSFGIRSFTVEVTTASEKPQLGGIGGGGGGGSGSNTDATKNAKANETPMENKEMYESHVTDGNNKLDNSGNTNEMRQLQQQQQAMRNDLANADESTDDGEFGMGIGKSLKNGLYRIKIAEIITDEFDNGLSEEAMNQKLAEDRRAYNGKINIADLYPSKIEDFSSVIKDSNVKLIREKLISVGREDDPDSTSDMIIDSLHKDSRSSINIPTTKIEIELVDEVDQPLSNRNGTTGDKITDFTSQLLKDSDGVISTIEKNFLNENVEEMSTNRPPVVTVNKPVSVASSSSFIDRRVKKFDPTTRYINDVKHIDIASTKFNSDGNGENRKNNEKPEFSTTKFYNSKELYNEMIHKRIQMVDDRMGNTNAKLNNNNINKPTTVIVEELRTTKPLTEKVFARRETEPPPSSQTPPSPSSSSSSSSISMSSSSSSSAATVKPVTPSAISSGTTTPIPATIDVNPIKTTAANLVKGNEPKTVSLNINTPKLSENANMQNSGDKVQFVRPITLLSDRQMELNTPSEIDLMSKMTISSKLTTHSPVAAAVATTPVTTPTTTKTNDKSPKIPKKSLKTYGKTLVSNIKSTSRFATKSSSKPVPSFPVSAIATATATTKTSLRSRVLTRLQEKINSLECDMQNVPSDSNVWRGNETHELSLPNTTPENCSTGSDCMPMIISWEGTAEIQSGDVLIVEVDDTLLIPIDLNITNAPNAHKIPTAVYQVTRPGHEHCDVTEGVLLDITPLVVDGKKLVTLYDKDLTEGINLLIVVSELWGQQCVRLKVTVKSDNCGENADCSGKGICYSNMSMEGYECQCCTGFAGSHCEEIDACSPSPCTNNGICVDLSQGHEGNSYQCLCPYGYTGKNCQFESDPCNPSACLNGGTCKGNATSFKCTCMPGFTGPLCQNKLNECESSPCVHGICVDQEDGFRCFCQPGFAGELCNFEYNECESNPCLNGGQCSDHIGGFSCKCTRGYTGKRCHIKVDFCASNPCPEGHRCNDRGDDFTCDCPGGRNGPDCNQVPRTLCNINPCANGGTCWTSEESFYCACRPGFTGKMCEDEFVVETVVSSSEIMSDESVANARPFGESSFSAVVSQGPIGLHNAYIAAGTFATAIFIVAIVVVVCHCKFHQSYRRFTTRHHQLIPIFGFGRRTKTSSTHRHWLSGKGGSGGSIQSSSNKSSTASLHTGQCQSNNRFSQQHGSSGGSNGGGGGGGGGEQQPRQEHRNHFNRHLAMNLENDMYYTVDFSDSQNSPLIQ